MKTRSARRFLRSEFIVGFLANLPRNTYPNINWDYALKFSSKIPVYFLFSLAESAILINSINCCVLIFWPYLCVIFLIRGGKLCISLSKSSGNPHQMEGYKQKWPNLRRCINGKNAYVLRPNQHIQVFTVCTPMLLRPLLFIAFQIEGHDKFGNDELNI